MQKIKIFNDPIYGFISLRQGIEVECVDHPLFQRLRRIKQLGLTYLVYPGALHSRFHHALGASHLFTSAVNHLRTQGTVITPEEEMAGNLATLLHDIGHGPFSHALESFFIPECNHEAVSLAFMEQLDQHFRGELEMAIAIFKGQYHKPFLSQLISSQLDVDRLDYLRRDSFYSGVIEGNVGSERIIKMLQVHDNQIVVQAKGIYSVEKFLLARRVMYWQVYLHKTVVAAEQSLIRLLRRARELALSDAELFTTPTLRFFLLRHLQPSAQPLHTQVLDTFALLDDFDIIGSMKYWVHNPDPILSDLANRILNRKLLKLSFLKSNIDPQLLVSDIQQFAINQLGFSQLQAQYLIFTDKVANTPYSATDSESFSIKILDKADGLVDLAQASDQFDHDALTKKVVKHFICYPQELADRVATMISNL